MRVSWLRESLAACSNCWIASNTFPVIESARFELNGLPQVRDGRLQLPLLRQNSAETGVRLGVIQPPGVGQCGLQVVVRVRVVRA